MDRRSFVLTAATAAAGLAAGGLVTPQRGLAAAAPTDDELVFASFGQAAELLLQDFYAKLGAAKLVSGDAAREVERAGFNAGEHAAALSNLLADAGQTPAVAADFTFVWPKSTFTSRKSASAAGLTITQAVLGVYLTATNAISIPSYRTLYASMAANIAQQIAALSRLQGERTVGVSFPASIDVETASDRIENFLD